ncbi:hypothetical protein ERO13_D01G017200v2 [Gossypium hirsutum]|uniref:Disease resistance protein SUMM2 n=2 Tax=Gossypium TaxID=3633 RepID=A0ABM2ZIW1_GOSHI|nr:disease resistance protein SUMM2-like [Gossypium hirsutum]KAG4160744.1 hypothetical protein ERO13_D01G017200v2 [Gossypium hirsutum]TYG81657.1 hypothetical protein ES288_D01G023200v1 [Gossypium darwinii]
MGNIFSISLDPIITRCWDCATGQASYICNLEDNLHDLQAEVAGLEELRSDLMSRVRIAEDEQQLQRLNQVEGWLSRAETLINDADQLIVQSPPHVENLCMGGCCSTHPRSSIKFGKQIAKKLKQVKDQKENGDFSDVASKPPLPSATERPSEPTVGLESNFDKVWSCLQKEQVGIIGIYGLGGVGKTTLLNQINNKFHDTTHDYRVIWAVASQDRPIEKVQDQIAKRIGLSNEGWESKSLDEKAEDIFQVLCKKKFALLLDDIWERFDLTRAGVPLPPKENGSKVIFTTRRFDVCCQMQPNMDNNIRVECLPPGEAFRLFEEKVGSETLRMHPDICKLAEAVVEECAGLPLALITIGRAMASKKTPREWEYAIEVLRQSAASVLPGVGKEMYPKLKFSYDCLAEKPKSCFLYCSLYPEDYPIGKDELVDCWIGEGLLDEHTNLSNVRNQGHFVIGSLIDACLLEEGKNKVRVKMHDVIRDMALWIAGESDKEKFCVKSGVQLKELPEAKKWEEVTRMSLMWNQIENLTEVLECPNLQTLFLGRNRLRVIINDFFNFMPMLRVLDLSYNMLEELPVGIAKLVSLEHLNLSWTGIKKLPVELKALAKLKYLNLEWTEHLEMIPQQLISSFSELQVQKMEGCRYGCLLVLEEMEHLKYLNVLTLTFRSASELEKASRFNKFFSCAIESVQLIGFRDSRSLNIMALAKLQHLYSLSLLFCLELEEVKIERNIIEGAGYFHSLRHVYLFGSRYLRDVSWVTFAPHLEVLWIFECIGLEEIISEGKLGEVAELKGNSNLFSKLEILMLENLPKLKTIYHHALSFPQLKEITIVKCGMLKKLPLNSNSAKGQRLVIEGDKGWWKDVEWEDESTQIAFLPSFKPVL